MASQPLTEWQLSSSRSISILSHQQNGNNTRYRETDSNNAIPNIEERSFSSLPNSYEIPSLRPRTARNSSNADHDKHNRSTNHSIPGLFGGRKEKKGSTSYKGEPPKPENGYDGKSRIPQSMERPSVSNPSHTDKSQPLTGNCMTCAGTVRWPQSLKVFRCTTCLTVNDLEPTTDQSGSQDWSIPSRKAIAVSLDRTRKLIDQCIEEYFLQLLKQDLVMSASDNVRMDSVDDVKDRSTTLEPHQKQTDLRPGPMVGRERTNSDSHLPLSRSFKSSQPESISHEPTSNQGTRAQNSGVTAQSRQVDGMSAEKSTDTSAHIFRDVEGYISSCFSGCTALNAAFFSVRSAAGQLESSISRDKITQQDTMSPSMPLWKQEAVTSELDAKTLLLGDIAENGSWWSGRPTPQDKQAQPGRERSPERWRGIVSAKTPRINWYELGEWYKIIIHAGDDWHTRWQALGQHEQGPRHQAWAAISSSRIKLAINDSQLHLQRVLLKSTENLLKRPRRPLKSPEDTRFLLMLLANPLLHSATQRPGRPKYDLSESTSNKSKSSAPSSSARRPNPTLGFRGSLGHHTGILKRIFGLLSNLSNECHQFLVSWMSRFSDSHFQRLVDLVSIFVTYRLSKQQDRSTAELINPTDGLVPSFSNTGEAHASQLHTALSLRSAGKGKKQNGDKPRLGVYSEDWQVKAAARFMSLLFQANTGHLSRKRELSITGQHQLQSAGLSAKYHAYSHGQILPISAFYNLLLDHADLVGDFEAWETTKSKFTFCQYPFFLSIWAKIRIMEHDARRQMEVKAREAFFDSILSRRAVSQFLVLKVRRDCLVDDSLRSVSQVVGSGADDIKKGLRIDFVGEEGVDAGGLRKEWFLLLVREIFDPQHGLFLYDDDSGYCYFNPYCFESSEQFFLVGVLLGLAIYNSTILDVAFPPFVFKRMLASAPSTGDKLTSTPKVTHAYTLEDLAEYRPALAKGLRQLLDFEGDVQETFCRDFVVELDKYGEIVQVPLRPNGENKPVTNTNRREFVDLYVRYLLDTAVARQYEPFKRGFFSVCGGNALSLFQPEEIELLVRGSDERLDVASLRAVASYDNWPKEAGPPESQPQVLWFWQTFEHAEPSDQRKLLGFITGSDRIPAMGTTNLTIHVQCIRDQEAEASGMEIERFPIARTCFNTINLYRYLGQETLETKLWMAVRESEGFGLK